MQTLRFDLPQDDYNIIEFSSNDSPGIMTVNAALKDFKHKQVFAWHLMVTVLLADTVKDNMPSRAEHELMIKFEDELDQIIRNQGNALFFASITQNGKRELHWRVYQPEVANDFLHDLIATEKHPRDFEFTLEQDIAWTKARWPLESLDGDFDAER